MLFRSVDARAGLVVTDRDTVPISLGDVRLTFGGSVEIPAQVVYIHPLHNLALLKYDPAHLGATPVRSAAFSTQPMSSGEDIWVAGLRSDQRLAVMQTRIASVEPADFPLSRSLEFRDTNVELAVLVNPPTDFDGVLLDHKGLVKGLWSTFVVDSARGPQQQTYGMPARLVVEMVENYRAGRPLRSIEAELEPVPLSFARKLGLDNAWINRLSAKGSHRQVMAVARTVAGTPAAESLQAADLLLV